MRFLVAVITLIFQPEFAPRSFLAHVCQIAHSLVGLYEIQKRGTRSGSRCQNVLGRFSTFRNDLSFLATSWLRWEQLVGFSSLIRGRSGPNRRGDLSQL